MPDTELIPPIGYGGAWTILGVILLALVVAAVIALLVVSRRRRVRPAESPRPVGGLPGLKNDYHGMVSAIEAEFASGSISARQAHHRLSAVVRAFGRAVSGVDAPVMTLTELQSSGLPHVTVAVAEYYPASFEAQDSSQIAPAVARARQVIESWG